MQPRNPAGTTASVVICTYNRCEGLPPVIKAVLNDPATAEVVVVVDGCHDGSYEMLTAWAARDPRIQPIWQENSGDRGGGARDTGVRAATQDIVVLLDDDVCAAPGLITGHVRAHQGRAHALVLGYMPTRLPERREAGQFATYLYAAVYEQEVARFEQDPQRILVHLWSGNMSLRREDAIRVGFATTKRVSYHSDQEFGVRCYRAGLQPVFDKTLRAEHQHHRPLPDFIRDVRSQGRARVAADRTNPDLGLWGDPRADLPAFARPLVTAAASRRMYPLATAGLRGMVKLAGALHAWPAETLAARAMSQVELLDSWQEAQRLEGDAAEDSSSRITSGLDELRIAPGCLERRRATP